jgi:hypothetical protein
LGGSLNHKRSRKAKTILNKDKAGGTAMLDFKRLYEAILLKAHGGVKKIDT